MKYYGRKKVVKQETEDIRDAFKWNDEDEFAKNRERLASSKSTSKWITEARDNYRVFVESPSKKLVID